MLATLPPELIDAALERLTLRERTSLRLVNRSFDRRVVEHLCRTRARRLVAAVAQKTLFAAEALHRWQRDENSFRPGDGLWARLGDELRTLELGELGSWEVQARLPIFAASFPHVQTLVVAATSRAGWDALRAARAHGRTDFWPQLVRVRSLLHPDLAPQVLHLARDADQNATYAATLVSHHDLFRTERRRALHHMATVAHAHRFVLQRPLSALRGLVDGARNAGAAPADAPSSLDSPIQVAALAHRALLDVVDAATHWLHAERPGDAPRAFGYFLRLDAGEARAGWSVIAELVSLLRGTDGAVDADLQFVRRLVRERGLGLAHGSAVQALCWLEAEPSPFAGPGLHVLAEQHGAPDGGEFAQLLRRTNALTSLWPPARTVGYGVATVAAARST